MQALMRTALLVLLLFPWGIELTLAQAYPPPASNPLPESNPPYQGGQYSSNEVIDAGHRFFGTVSRGLAEIVERAANGACPTDMSWGRRPAVLGSLVCVTVTESCTPRMPVTVGSTGKDPPSVSILAARVPAP
jgi:hypothetical protein